MSVDFERKTRKKRRWGRTIEYGSYERRYVFGDVYDEVKKKIEKSVAKSKGFTVQSVANENDIRVSVAKRILRELEEEGKVSIIVNSQRTKIYNGGKVKTE